MMSGSLRRHFRAGGIDVGGTRVRGGLLCHRLSRGGFLRLLFLALRAKHPRLKEITIEGLHLLPEDAFYGTDILMEVEGSLLYPPLEEVSLLFYEAGIRHFT